MSSHMSTHLLEDGDVRSRVVLARLLRVVRYRPLALGELLGRGFGVRHVVSISCCQCPGEELNRMLEIVVNSRDCAAYVTLVSGRLSALGQERDGGLGS
jgi:hypothetical protein